jgi:hypothetical protein
MSKTLIPFGAVMASSLGMTVGGKKTSSENASDDGESAGQSTDAAAEAADNVVGDAAKATDEFLSESKDTAVKTAQETLDGIEKKWRELREKVAPATDEAKADFQKSKDLMAQSLTDAKAKLVEAKNASADVWQKDVKPALDAAVQKTKKLYEDAAAKFSGK